MTRSEDPARRLASAIDTLLRRRSDLLLAYTALLALDADEVDRLPAAVQRLSQVLTDYSALWHFEVMAGAGRDAPPAEELRAPLRIIDASTDRILDFGDRFGPGAQVRLTELCREMEALALALAERFEAEDRVLRQLSRAPAVAG